MTAFIERLRSHGDNLAVVTADARLTYQQLAERVEALASKIGTGRRLVLVEAANDPAALTGYLGALHGGHVALLVPRSDTAQIATLIDRFDPDVVIGADGEVKRRRTGSGHRLHPDLALLMTTSGSTGTPRLVRLSGAALDANAAAIATYLDIGEDDRAALTLPMHYCYGLSVINSNLLCGATVLLSDASVLDTAFWTALREHRATSLHGVPYTFELLEHVGFADMSMPRLRYVTQAGGRLAPEKVQHWAKVGRQQGWQFYVMYGQTEATARMAYLPPELAESHPEAVGVAIPGGSFSIEPLDAADESAAADDDGIGEVGELVYRGPNVMLGYADQQSDLAQGRTIDALRTGDLGRRRPDGLIEVVGRRSRFVKPFGIRTDLDGLEHLLAGHAIEAACAGTDSEIIIAARAGAAQDAEDLREQIQLIVTERLALPASAVTVLTVDEFPRRLNGKLDHPAVARLARRETLPVRQPRLRALRSLLPTTAPSTTMMPTAALPTTMRRRRQRAATVREVFARTFPGQDLTDDASFVNLGGDSLTYVQVSADIERVLGGLPDGWDHLPLGTLETLPAPDESSGRRSGRATIETGVLLRALAIVLVVGEHAHLWAIVGGAHLLFALSGWTFARFILANERTPDRSTAGLALPRRILNSAARIAAPSALWITFRALLHNVRFVDILLVGSLVPPLVPGYWFVDALVQILLLMALLFTLPALRHLERRYPFGVAAAILSIALLGRLYPTAHGWWFTGDIYSTQVVLWLFVLGWMAHRATTRMQKWMTVAAIFILVPSFFGTDALRTVIVVGGLLLLQFLPTITVPRAVATAATTLATASLGIYLTHFGILPLGTLGAPRLLVVGLSLVVGIAMTWVVTAVVRCLKRRPLSAYLGAAAMRRPRLALGTARNAVLDAEMPLLVPRSREVVQ